MKHFQPAAPASRVPVVLNGTSVALADIVSDLPELGDLYDGRAVLEVRPSPLTWPDQKAPDVWQYAIWHIHLAGNVWRYLAIHEPESETM